MKGVINPQLKKAALEFAQQGIKIFPVLEGDKHPAIGKKQGGNGYLDSTSDINQIEAWWSQNPNFNIGLAAEMNDVFVLDVDLKTNADGYAELYKLEDKYGKLPNTLRVKTPTGGLHYYFRLPKNVKISNIQNGGKLPVGLDIRSNGYVLVPPSIHPNGKAYQWVDTTAAIVPAPEWLITIITTPVVSGQGSVVQTELSGEVIPEGQRDDYMFRLASKLRGQGWEQSEIEAHLLMVNQTRCVPPMNEHQVLKCAKQGAQYPPNPTVGFTHSEPQPALIPPPLGVDKPDDGSLQMPQGCLYGLCGEMAVSLETPLGFAYPAILASCSPSVQPHMYCRSNIYVVLLGQVGTGKTVAMHRALQTVELPVNALVTETPGSDRGLLKSVGGDENHYKQFLIQLDEMGVMMKKVKIEGSGLAGHLCTLWDKDITGSNDKAGKYNANCRLSILAGMKIEDPSQFAEMFGSETNDGLSSRFIYGLASDTFEWQPFAKVPSPLFCSQPDFPKEMFDMSAAWRKQSPTTRGRLTYNANRVALITASVNGDTAITEECMKAALMFAEWQERIQQEYKTGKAETVAGKCSEMIMNVVAAIPKGEARKWSDLAKLKHWYSKYGIDMCKRSRDGLVSEGVIAYERKTGLVWNPEL